MGDPFLSSREVCNSVDRFWRVNQDAQAGWKRGFLGGVFRHRLLEGAWWHQDTLLLDALDMGHQALDTEST
jgi:hypothetical protein